MKKAKILMLFSTIFTILLLLTLYVYHNRLTDVENTKSAQNSKYSNEIETLKQDDYNILLKGSARPENGEISVEKAAEIGFNEYKKTNSDSGKEYKVEMVFLDGILKKTGSWSGHIITEEGSNKYEFLVDGKTGSLDFTDNAKSE